MKNMMGVTPHLATFLYVAVRCGVAHQGMPKIGLKYFVEYSRRAKGIIFYHSSSDDHIYLNIVELAYLYLDTIEKIAASIDTYLFHVPTTNAEAKRVFDDAVTEITNDADELADKIGTEDQEPGCSLAAFSPDNILNITPDSP